jgi:hypothetical protein
MVLWFPVVLQVVRVLQVRSYAVHKNGTFSSNPLRLCLNWANNNVIRINIEFVRSLDDPPIPCRDDVALHWVQGAWVPLYIFYHPFVDNLKFPAHLRKIENLDLVLFGLLIVKS